MKKHHLEVKTMSFCNSDDEIRLTDKVNVQNSRSGRLQFLLCSSGRSWPLKAQDPGTHEKAPFGGQNDVFL
jgi:hypothetical protein